MVSPALTGKERTDAVLMIRAQADDADAFAELYDRHSARAFRVARAVCSDVGRAEDAVQDGFLAIWRCRASYRGDTGSFQAWSMQIVRHRAIDSFRGTAARDPSLIGGAVDVRPQTDIDADSSLEESIAQAEHEEMIASLSRLPEAQSEVIVLAFYGGLSHSEIATRLGLSAGTVKGRMRLGLGKLRREMAHPAPPPGAHTSAHRERPT